MYRKIERKTSYRKNSLRVESAKKQPKRRLSWWVLSSEIDRGMFFLNSTSSMPASAPKQLLYMSRWLTCDLYPILPSMLKRICLPCRHRDILDDVWYIKVLIPQPTDPSCNPLDFYCNAKWDCLGPLGRSGMYDAAAAGDVVPGGAGRKIFSWSGKKSLRLWLWNGKRRSKQSESSFCPHNELFSDSSQLRMPFWNGPVDFLHR